MRKTIAIVALLAVTASLMLSAPAGAAKKKKKKSGPMVVGTDAAGDWGTNAPAAPPPEAGAPLGQDLLEASIGMGEDGKTINFIIKVSQLPPTGGMPEFTRYTWDFSVDGSDSMEIDGKWTNYTRGACDPTSGQCPPPRDPGQQPFLVRGNCTETPTPATTLILCEELANVQGIFDAAAGTITVPVPAEAIDAKPGSKITGMPGTFDAPISAAPSAFLTYGSFPMDTLFTTGTFVVPKK